MNTPHMATNTKAESNHLNALKRFMVSSLGGVHQIARLANRLQPTPQRASVSESILHALPIGNDRFATARDGR